LNNRKGQNSILFLTTLGVYLGLVLVGATPVLGHAATTRNFEISDEIEIKDDLDKNPDRRNETTFVEEIASLLSTLNSYVEEDKFTWNSKFEFNIEDLSFAKDGKPSFLGFGTLESPEGRLFEHSALAAAQSLIVEKVEVSAGEKYSTWPETVNLKFRSDGSNIRFDITVSTADDGGAKRLNSALSDFLKRIAQDSKSAMARIVAEKTTSEVDNVKVILVTRLPRAALDPLLAKDAK
jgi:hypothetical protein